MNWTREWPTEPGWYWFYGVEAEMPIRLMSVEVVASNRKTLMYKAGMVYIYPGSAEGVWQPAEVPDEPPSMAIDMQTGKRLSQEEFEERLKE